MATISGQDGAVTIAAAAVTGKITNWDLNVTSKNFESPGAGDDWMERVHLLSDWEASVEFNAPDQAAWDLHQGLVGTNAALALKRKTGDANPYFSATGLVTDAKVTSPIDGAITGTLTVKCSQATAPTFDTTPAT